MRNGFFYKYIYPILLNAILTLLSHTTTGNWRLWFHKISVWGWILFGVTILLWITIRIIRNRFKKPRKSGSQRRTVLVTLPNSKWIPMTTLNYAGVKWRIRAPEPYGYFDTINIPPNSLEAETPPRCPECETELRESESFWIGYVWQCANCGFHKRNRNSFSTEADRVEKIAKRKWEKKIEEKSK